MFRTKFDLFMEKMKRVFVVILFFTAVFSYAQSRDDILILIPMPLGGASEQQAFFQEQFTMETTAAGYTVTESQKAADYVLKLTIGPNMIEYDDGTSDMPGPYDPQYLLKLNLVRNEDNADIVEFEFPFTELSEMYDFNLYLLYQAMANVPITKLTDILEYDHWRNKWLYLRADVDYVITAYLADGNQSNREWDGTKDAWNPLDDSRKQEVALMVGATIGLEFQFLNWMSMEGDFKFIFGDPSGANGFIPTMALYLKFPIKPAKYFMLEPYLGADFPNITLPFFREKTIVGVGGGFQLGVRGGNMGAFFVDVSYMYDIGELWYYQEKNLDVHWNRWVLGIGLGYKVGFFNRNKEAPSR
jgi:hypothetical protein